MSAAENLDVRLVTGERLLADQAAREGFLSELRSGALDAIVAAELSVSRIRVTIEVHLEQIPAANSARLKK